MGDLGDFGLRVIREALENMLEDGLTSTIVLEALGRLPEDEDLPRSRIALVGFVQGPLAGTLVRHLDGPRAEEVVGGAVQALTTALDEKERAQKARSARGVRRMSQQPTHAMASASGPIRLLVVARSERLLTRIGAAFGLHRMSGVGAKDQDELTKYYQQLDPTIVILDGQDAGDIRPEDVGTLLAGSGDRVMVVIWAADQPFGSALARGLIGRDLELASVPRAAGVESLLDYIRARAE